MRELVRNFFIQTAPSGNPPGLGGIVYRGHLYNLELLYAGTRNSAYEENKDKKFPWIREHVHDKLYHLVLYVAGKNKLSINGSLHDAERGVIAIVPPGCSHMFNPLIKGGSFTYQEVAFTFSGRKGGHLKIPFSDIFSYYSGRPIETVPFFLTLDERMISSVSEKINAITEELLLGGRSACFSAHCHMIEIFSMIIIKLCDFAASRPPDKKAKESIGRIKEYIERKYFEALTLKGLADMANVTPEHLCRCFREMYEIPPLSYQQTLRISAAKNLLHTSSLSCKEISFMVGFSNEQFFSRQFKRMTGISPSAYRKQVSGV